MNLTPEIERRIQSFVTELDGLIRQAALEAVQVALAGSSPRATTTAAAKPAKTVAPKSPAAPRRGKSGKRDPGDLAKLVDAVRAHIAQHPGEGVETIGKHMGVATKDLALPITKLLEAKHITRKGARRGTRYFPAK